MGAILATLTATAGIVMLVVGITAAGLLQGGAAGFPVISRKGGARCSMAWTTTGWKAIFRARPG